MSLPGFVENPYKYLACAAVFVLSSQFEGFGMALAEALALGIPCVATDCPNGPAEILEDGRLGWLVPVDDVSAVAEAIVEAANTPRSSDHVRNVRDRFSLDAAVSKYLALSNLPDFCPASIPEIGNA
jgi:glycosyltransferase involved in cell wall biosynthesis